MNWHLVNELLMIALGIYVMLGCPQPMDPASASAQRQDVPPGVWPRLPSARQYARHAPDETGREEMSRTPGRVEGRHWHSVTNCGCPIPCWQAAPAMRDGATDNDEADARLIRPRQPRPTGTSAAKC